MTAIYGDLADALAYHNERGNAAWAGAADDATRSAALLNASEYVDSFAAQYPGTKTGGRAQERAWPRSGVTFLNEDVPDDEIPKEIEYATYEAALLIIKGVDLRPIQERGGAIKRERVKGGPVEVETEYMDSASSGTTFTKIQDLLAVWMFSVATGYGYGYELLRV